MFANINALDLARVIPFAPTEDVRYYLNGVNVEPLETGGALLVCTNGHMLAAIHSQISTAERPFVMRATKQLRLAIKQASRMESGCVAIETAKSMVEVRGMGKRSRRGEPTFYVQPGGAVIDGKYPDWRKIVPAPEKMVAGLPGGYNVKYLATAFALAGQIPESRYGNGMTFSHDTEHPKDGAVFFHFGPNLGDLLVVCMPMRMSDSEVKLPAWTRVAMPASQPEEKAA